MRMNKYERECRFIGVSRSLLSFEEEQKRKRLRMSPAICIRSLFRVLKHDSLLLKLEPEDPGIILREGRRSTQQDTS